MTADLVPAHPGPQAPAPFALGAEARQSALGFFARIWDSAYQAEIEALTRKWASLRPDWLRAVSAKSRSPHTARAYNRCLDSFWIAIEADPWLVSDGRRLAYQDLLRAAGVIEYTAPWAITARHVQAWIAELEARGLAPASVNQYIAGASSFYSFIAGTRELVAGIEVSLFCDAEGRPRANPFRDYNVRRPPVEQYGRSHPLTLDQVRALRQAINGPASASAEELAILARPTAGRAVIDYRDHALIALLLFTGRRAAEIAGLRWGDIEPGPDPGSWIFRWAGKGGKRGVQPLPAEAYFYTVAWLKAADRWPAGPGDYIFRPISVDGLAHLDNVRGDGYQDRPISTGQINNIVRKLARRAGLPLDLVHTHTLRHTFAYHHHRARGDVKALQELLGHSNIATTGIYLSSPGFNKPVDNFGHLLQHSFKF